MKRINVFALIAMVAAIPATSCVGLPGFGLVGDGKVVDSERSVSGFSAVESGGSAVVRIKKGPAVRVVVATDGNIQDYFEARVSGGSLFLGFKPGTSVIRYSKLVVDVYMPTLEAVKVSGSGDLSIADEFNGDALEVKVSGSGSVAGTVRYGAIDAGITGSGAVTLQGSAKALSLMVSGSGRFDGRALALESANAGLSGSGDARLRVSGALKVRLSGSGSVEYSGNPTVDADVSGSGRVRHTSE